MPNRNTAIMFSTILGATLMALAGTQAMAQTYPNKPIRLIVPYTPGGGTDILARTMAQKMGDTLGQPILVDNKPGGGTVIGAELTAKSAPDGYTTYISAPSIVTNHSLVEKLPYDALKDFVSVTQWVGFSNILLVHPSLGVKSVRELIALAKQKPGTINYASTGSGSTPHLCMELLNAMAGTNLVHVPYKGNAPAKVDLLSGRVSVFFEAAVTAMPDIKSGKLLALGVSGGTRSQITPELPTIAEAGVPGYDATTWIGLFTPAGVNKEVVDKLYNASIRTLRMPDVKELLLAQGFEPVGSSPEQFAALMRSELVKWNKLIKSMKDAGVKLD